MNFPVLYSFRRCPYAIRARLAIAYSGVQVELREVILKDKPTEMLNVSQKGTVPVLINQSDEVIDESIDIMIWALEKNDPENWYYCLEQQSVSQGNELIACNDNEFKYFLDRYKYHERYPEHGQEHYFKQAELFLQKLDALLKKNHYLLGDRLSWADIAILPFIRQFAFVDKQHFDQLPYDCIKNWLEKFLDSELFNQVMKKYKKWEQSDKPCFFP